MAASGLPQAKAPKTPMPAALLCFLALAKLLDEVPLAAPEASPHAMQPVAQRWSEVSGTLPKHPEATAMKL